MVSFAPCKSGIFIIFLANLSRKRGPEYAAQFMWLKGKSVNRILDFSEFSNLNVVFLKKKSAILHFKSGSNSRKYFEIQPSARRIPEFSRSEKDCPRLLGTDHHCRSTSGHDKHSQTQSKYTIFTGGSFFPSCL